MRVNSVSGMYVSGMHRYLTHSTEKTQRDGKFQYAEDELHPENGFSVEVLQFLEGTYSMTEFTKEYFYETES